MARPGNRHCANCIGTLSSPIVMVPPLRSVGLYARKGLSRFPSIASQDDHLRAPSGLRRVKLQARSL